MPELPEVESLRLSLLSICQKQIRKVQFSKLAPVETCKPQAIVQALQNQNITQLRRVGKYLLVEVSSGVSLVVHLGMSGKLLYYKNKLKSNAKHTHMVIQFNEADELHFVDPRRFGTLSLTRDGQGQDNAFLKNLGRDFLDETFNEDHFVQSARRHPKITLKNLCLNQQVATGLGNIYACEALYAARLSPLRLVADCSTKQLQQLFVSARAILQAAVCLGGTSFRDYLDGLGHRGLMKGFLQVYDRENSSSLDGVAKVIRIVQNGRSTFYCPKVQK